MKQRRMLSTERQREIVTAMAEMVRGQSLVKAESAWSQGHNAGVESAARIVEDCLPGLLANLWERPENAGEQTADVSPKEEGGPADA